ncbi:MAG: hypothetical protein HXS52_03775 [Theionarchaea archaeon]|nr:hypothetical protein [Theionarchaea archaeon]
MDNMEIEVSDRINTFLLLSFKKRKLSLEIHLEKTKTGIFEGIKEWRKTYREELEILQRLNPEDREEKMIIEELCSRKLFFQFEDAEREENSYNDFSHILLGRHDFVYLLESPNLVETSSILHNINKKLEEQGLIEESENISGIPMDFTFDCEGKCRYFIGENNAWFRGEGHSFRRIKMYKSFIYAIFCIEFKKGAKEEGQFVNLPEFLLKLEILRDELRRHAIGMFLGFGLHDLILILGSEKISDIVSIVLRFREIYLLNRESSTIRDTSTIFCLPEEEPKNSESSEDIEYSTLVSIVTGSDNLTYQEIRSNDVIRSCVQNGEIRFFERQGYYDLIMSFRPKSHYSARHVTEELFKIDSVLKTSTIVKMEKEEGRKHPQD